MTHTYAKMQEYLKACRSMRNIPARNAGISCCEQHCNWVLLQLSGAAKDGLHEGAQNASCQVCSAKHNTSAGSPPQWGPPWLLASQTQLLQAEPGMPLPSCQSLHPLVEASPWVLGPSCLSRSAQAKVSRLRMVMVDLLLGPTFPCKSLSMSAGPFISVRICTSKGVRLNMRKVSMYSCDA